MRKKILLLGFFFLTCITGYGLVFGGNFSFSSDVRFVGSASQDVYLDIPYLASNIVIYNSSSNISDAKLVSNCFISSKFLSSYKTLYFFEVDYSQAPDCKNGNIVLEQAGQKLLASMTSLQIKNTGDEFSIYLDLATDTLQNIRKSFEGDQKRYAIYKNYNKQDIAKYYTYLQGQRKYLEASQKIKIIDHIIAARTQKYVSPVPGKTVSDRFTKVPNSKRPYRAGYTDGIHHGWDIDAPIGTPVAALDDGIIVRVVRDFDSSDFSRIIYGNSLSDEDKLKNLDILRGRQVWIKTMKGEVVFYSHLDSIIGEIQEGKFVSQGTKLGEVGISGVPEEGYADSHLHFEIAENPYISDTAGTYDFGDYMAWSWLTKGMNETQTLEAQKNIFK